MFDVSGPFPAENNGCTLGHFPKHNSANPMARCIHYPDVIRPTRDQLSTPCWFFGRFTEEDLTPLKHHVRTAAFRCKYTYGGCFLKTRLHGDSRPHPVGMLLNACRIFKMVDLYSLNRIPTDPCLHVRIHPLRIVRNFSCFADSNHMVFASPSRSNHKSVF